MFKDFFILTREVFYLMLFIVIFDVNTQYAIFLYNFIYIKAHHYSVLQHKSFTGMVSFSDLTSFTGLVSFIDLTLTVLKTDNILSIHSVKHVSIGHSW
jgi:hypothetical protein